MFIPTNEFIDAVRSCDIKRLIKIVDNERLVWDQLLEFGVNNNYWWLVSASINQGANVNYRKCFETALKNGVLDIMQEFCYDPKLDRDRIDNAENIYRNNHPYSIILESKLSRYSTRLSQMNDKLNRYQKLYGSLSEVKIQEDCARDIDLE